MLNTLFDLPTVTDVVRFGLRGSAHRERYEGGRSKGRSPSICSAVIRPATPKGLSARELGIFGPEEHLLVGFIELLEPFLISTLVGVMELGQLFVSSPYFAAIAFKNQVLPVQMKDLETILLMNGKPRASLSVGHDFFGIDLFSMVLVQQKKGCKTSRMIVAHHAMPFLTRLENEAF
jgi:hypothetical protein